MRAPQIAAFIALALIVCAGFGWAQGWDAGDIWTADDAAATPLTSWFGTTGLIVVPSAETLAPEGIQAHVNVIEGDEGEDDWCTIWGANVSLYEGLEAGVTGLDSSYTGAQSETLLQAKYRLPMDRLFGLPEEAPMIAVGGRDLGEEINRTWYVVLSKDVPLDENEERSMCVTLGFGDAQLPDSPLDGVFGGVELPLFEYAQLQAEYDGENFNAALRYWWNEWAVIEMGVLDDNLAFGFTINSGF